MTGPRILTMEALEEERRQRGGILERAGSLLTPEAIGNTLQRITLQGARQVLAMPWETVASATQALTEYAANTARSIGSDFQGWWRYRHLTELESPATDLLDALGIPFFPETRAERREELAQEDAGTLREQYLRTEALLASTALDIALGPTKLATNFFFDTLGKGAISGGLYGLLRPREDSESLAEAVAKDAALFGGANLLIGGAVRGVQAARQRIRVSQELFDQASPDIRGELVGAAREGSVELPQRPPTVTVDGTTARISAREGVWTASARGKSASGASVGEALEALDVELGSNIGAGIRNLEQLQARDEALRGLVPQNVDVVAHPRDLGPIGRFLAPIHSWAKTHPIAGQIRDNMVNRRLVQSQIRAEWGTLIKRTKEALKPEQRIELGHLLDAYVRGEDIPAGTPDNLIQWFGLWRERLNIDRKLLGDLLGASPDWGIEAYFMHVFVGEWKVVDAVAGSVLELGTGTQARAGFARSLAEAKQFAADFTSVNPGAPIRIVPNRMAWQDDAAVALGTRAYHRLLSVAGDALSLERDEVAELLSQGRVTRPAGGKKFFGHALARERNLQGFILDPVEAAEAYSAGFARKIAFHDAEPWALRMLEQVPPELVSLRDGLKQYIADVVGKPGPFQLAWDAAVRFAAGNSDLPLGASHFTLYRVAQATRKLESNIRLGYSPISAFANLSQVLVNTSTKLGYADTLAGMRYLSRIGKSKAAREEIDKLLVDLGVELHVPLSAMDVYADLGKVSWWHPLYLFNKTETINRAVSSVAAYRKALREGATRPDAINIAKRFNESVNFVYSVEDLPRILASPAAGVLGQFKAFLLNELYFISQLKGAEIPRFIANLTAAGGIGALMSLPPAVLLDVAVGEATGERISERVQRRFPRLGRGLPGLAGIDVSRNLSLSNVSPGATISGEQSALTTAFDMSLGPFTRDFLVMTRDVLPSAIRKAVRVTQGDPRSVLTPEERARIVRQLAPTMLRRTFDAYRVARDGVVVQPTTGRPIFEPDSPTAEALTSFFGASSVRRSERLREDVTIRRIALQRQAQRRSYVRQILEARERGDSDAVNALVRDARSRGIAITNDMLQRARQEAAETTEERALQALPRRERAQVERRVRSVLP